MKINSSKILEWGGVITAILYSCLIAFNINLEFFGFLLLCLSSFLIGTWAYLENHKGILILQFFYAIIAIIGMIKWYE